ncbi:MAG TPA: DUF3307 domain-containing protein [Leeuwenhoekiella sp.]|nr:DUF3307 domain-containing protein [Leeuwenhoekiella sp.]
MPFINLILLQAIAHLLADYTFQTKKMAVGKDKLGFKSKMLKWHIGIVFITSAILGLQWSFVPFSLAIALIHWLIDGCKPLMRRNIQLYKYVFFIDQTLHLLVFSLTVYLYTSYFNWKPLFGWELNSFVLVLILAFLFCTKPANILIREIFNAYEIFFEGGGEDLPNAGRLIGIIERWLVLVFIITGQFSAVGFLIGAKSILRFKDANLLKTEYVLVGTLLSFGIAVIQGVLIHKFGFLLS